MKHLLLALTLSLAPAMAQVTLTATASPATVRPGQSTTVTLTLAGTPAVAGIQWSLGLPLGWTGTQIITPAVSTIPKTLTCGTGTPPICLIWGLNVLPIPVGSILTLPLTIPTTAAPGPATIALTGLFSGSPAGVTVPITGVNAVITVLSPFDINGDGQVTAVDVNLIVAQVASGTCTSDVVGNGQCNILQVLAEVIGWAAAGSKP
jgi:hypothetical protein